ncbi:UPF0187-domain-containing protein [Conidiobolus coronatus NRRL 28638]|uniref:UPF0187-domain-containing protein n=1 Tax=Conidiobolus coronatus (strain ATCC 28846 / CBS 209.66 / NRRL 28638) TaxID=796925 RepID=A0A137P5I5_CONC2|nr:UPF0187-domain-containing protein [Conidiobolus coronatus NRRL 28638]|eukprot:KXN70219.1 UPF0187-domain-containing protein [Conidiobolus coronatus NRRL 28638]
MGKQASIFSNIFSIKNRTFIYRGTIIPKLLLKVVFFIVWSAVVCIIHTQVSSISIKSALLSISQTFISLLLAFRANIAYSRFWSGARIWYSMESQLRNLSLRLWTQVPENTEEEREEKQTMLNMLLCFHISTKHYLRNEFGVNFEDLLPLIQNIPELIKLKKTEFTTCEIPLQLNHFILSYFHELHNNRNLSEMLFDHLRSELRDIQDAFMNLKRYMDTPIPLAYTAHLSQCVWISCIFIPFQMLNIAKSNSWVVIPFSTISCFILFGILTLSEEIESPFGFGYNKLPLDKYSKDFAKQLEFIKGLPVVGTSGNQFVKFGQ